MIARAALVVLIGGMLATAACDDDSDPHVSARTDGPSKTIVLYDNDTISGNIAVWNPRGLFVDGFRHVSVFVEFEQKTAEEPPVSVGIGFGPMENGRVSARSVFDFSNGADPDSQVPRLSPSMPHWIEGSGHGSWHGEQGIASFVLRSAVLGPYMWVYPLNNHDKVRHFSIVAYLTR